MSRIGKLPIHVPAGVTVTIKDNVVTVKGPKGELVQEVNPDINVTLEDGVIHLTRPTDDKNHRALHGLYRSLINNMVVGVTKGWEKKLVIAGVGWKAQVTGNKLVLNLGYSHQVEVEIPSDLKVTCPQLTEIVVSGIDKQKVGQFCAIIRSKRPYEPYHGYGVHAEGETLVRKVGKAAGKGKK